MDSELAVKWLVITLLALIVISTVFAVTAVAPPVGLLTAFIIVGALVYAYLKGALPGVQ